LGAATPGEEEVTTPGRKIHHWKHGWIPLDAYARAIVAEREKSKDKKALRRIPADSPLLANTKGFQTAPATEPKVKPGHRPLIPQRSVPDVPSVEPTQTGRISRDPRAEMEASNRIFLAIDNFVNHGITPTPQEYNRMSLPEKIDLQPLTEKDLTPPEVYADRYLAKQKIHKDPVRALKASPVVVSSKTGDALLESIRKDGGFTYDPKKGGLLKVGEAHGFAVAIPGTEEIIGEEKVNGEDVTREDFAKGVAAVILKHRRLIDQGAVLGGWYSPERNQYMVEMSQIVPPRDRDFATRLAKARNQEAIFDLSTGEVIVTGGTGDAHPEDKVALTAFGDKLSPEEIAAAKYYTGPGYAPINSALRTGGTPPPAANFYMSKLDQALSKSTVAEDQTAFRGVWGGDWLPKSFAPGDTITDAGYVSTAVDPNGKYDGDTQMVIRVPKGTHAIDLDGSGLTHHANEKELLLPRGTKMRVISDLPNVNGQRVINLEVVSG
jgi:hypothetical protein